MVETEPTTSGTVITYNVVYDDLPNTWHEMETIATNNGGRFPTKTEMDDYVSGVNNGTITTKPHEQYASDATQHSVWFAISEEGLSGYTTTIRPFYKITDNSGVLTGEVHNNGANPGAVDDGNHNVFKWVWYITESTETATVEDSQNTSTPTMTGTYNTDSFLSPDDNEMYEYAQFTDDGSIEFPKDTVCDILMVGGGGAGNPGESGGSSGGLLYYTNAFITKGSIYNISVGKGGQNPGDNGNSSSISKENNSITAVGGSALSDPNTNDLFTYGTLENDLIYDSEQKLLNNITGSSIFYGGGGKLYQPTILKKYDDEKMYPPVRNFSSDNHTVSGQPYGNGLYEVSASSFHTSGSTPIPAYTGFNDTAGFNQVGFHAAIGNYTNGVYNKALYIVDDYLGDWLKIKLPVAVNLTKYGFKQRSVDSFRSPGQYKIYGSNDNSNWTELVHKSTTITYDGLNYEESISTLGIYNYFVIVVNKLSGNQDVLNFDEWYIYGREPNMYPPVRNFSSNNHTVSGQPYGNGLYEVSASTVHAAFPAYTGFNDTNVTGFHAVAGQYSSSTGVYTANTHYIVNDYLGDWLKIKLPVAVNLTKYRFKTRGPNITRPPGKYKIYGSNDNTNWSELVHKTTNVTYSDAGDGSYYYEESISTLGIYNYFVIVVNQLSGTGVDVLNFDEWYIYGQEQIELFDDFYDFKKNVGEADNLTYLITFAEDTTCDLLTTIDEDVSETVTFIQNQKYQVNLYDTTWDIVNESTSEILTSGTSQNIIVKWSILPVLNKYGYGGNSTVVYSYSGGDGVVIIKWKKSPTTSTDSFGDRTDNLLLWYNFNSKITTNVSQILLGGSGIHSSLISPTYGVDGTNGINIPITGDTNVYYGGGGSGYNITSNLSGTSGFGEIGRGGDGGLIPTNGNDGGIIIRVPKISNDPIIIFGGGGGTLQNGTSSDLTTPIPNGGEGLSLPITGTLLNYAGGGGGASTETNGDRVPSDAIYGYGANSSLTSGFNGGDGIVIIKWRASDNLIPLTQKVITEGDLTGTGILKSSDVSVFDFSKILFRNNTISNNYFKTFDISIHSISAGTLLFSGIVYRNYDIYKTPISIDYSMMFSFYLLNDISTTSNSITFKNSTIYFEDNDICRLSPDNDDMITISSK